MSHLAAKEALESLIVHDIDFADYFLNPLHSIALLFEIKLWKEN